MSKTNDNDEANKAQTGEEILEIGEKELGQISGAVKEAIMPDIKESVKETVKEASQDMLDAYIAKTEQTDAKKNTGDGDDAENADDPVAKGIADGRFADIAKMSKEMRLYRAARALASGNLIELKRFSEYSLAARQKAGYANETTDADGAVLVPDPEFDTTIYDNLAKYGVAFQYADMRRTDRNAVYAITLDSGLEFYATAEAGLKQSAKLVFSRKLVELQKYAVIVPATDELTEDAAIDFWNLVTRELSRAWAKKADEIVFTDATSGITNTTGVLTEPVSGAGSTLSWDDLLNAEGKPEDGFDSSNARWFMRRETWFRLVQSKDSQDRYLFQPNPNNPTTPWGTPVVFTRVLPKGTEVSSNDGFAVFGDLRNYLLYSKNGLALTLLTEGIVDDADGNDFNLAQQDAKAMRAVVRMLGMLPKGNAGKFVVVGTGTVS